MEFFQKPTSIADLGKTPVDFFQGKSALDYHHVRCPFRTASIYQLLPIGRIPATYKLRIAVLLKRPLCGVKGQCDRVSGSGGRLTVYVVDILASVEPVFPLVHGSYGFIRFLVTGAVGGTKVADSGEPKIATILAALSN